MANSLLGLNTENPVTSSRIKYTHTDRGFPTWKRFQTKTQDSASPAERAAGPPRWGFPVPQSPGAEGTRGRGGGDVGQPENAPFCLQTMIKTSRGGGGEGQEGALRKRRGRKTKTTGSSVPAPLGHRGKRLPKPQWRLPAGTQPAPSAGTPSAARPPCCDRIRDGRGDPERCRRLEQSGA